MKTPLFYLIALFGLVVSFSLTACGPSLLPEYYQVQLPPLPLTRMEVLGQPQWRLEWYDSSGKFQQKEISGNTAKISILYEWPSAVLAWPYWPEKKLAAGYFYPAGALFPLDTRGDTIILNWRAGPEAYFYRELDTIRGLNLNNRLPEYFDWKRFRTLLREGTQEELRRDPWLANWKHIAENTLRSGFRSSLLRADTRINTEVTIPHEGPWFGASVFSPIRLWEEGEILIIPLSSRPEILVCPGGILHISAQNRLWMPFP